MQVENIQKLNPKFYAHKRDYLITKKGFVIKNDL